MRSINGQNIGFPNHIFSKIMFVFFVPQTITQREGGKVVNGPSDSYDKARRYSHGERWCYISCLQSQRAERAGRGGRCARAPSIA